MPKQPDTYTDRTATLNAQIAVRTSKSERAIRALEDQITAERVGCEQEIASLRGAADKQSVELANAIAADFHATVGPLISEWIAEPSRGVATGIADAYRAADARAIAELGENLWPSVIAVAFGVEIIAANPDAANVFGPDNGQIVQVVGGFPRAVSQGAGAVEHALRCIERELASIASSAPGPAHEGNAARFAVKKACATHTSASRKLRAFDADQMQAAQAAALAAPTIRERVSAALGL